MCRRHFFCFHQNSSFLSNANTVGTLHYEIPLLQQPRCNLVNLFTFARQDYFLLSLAFSEHKKTRLVHNIDHSF